MPLTRAQLDARIDTADYPDEAPDGTTVQGATIEGHVWEIYQTPTGQKMIDEWLTNNPTDNIKFNFRDNDAAASLKVNPDLTQNGDNGLGQVFYDEDFDTAGGNFVYLDKNGVAVDEKDVGTVAHELVHALTNKQDNWDKPEYLGDDYAGDNVTKANQIFSELEDKGFGTKEQLSYPGQSQLGNLVVGTDYSDGRKIDRAWAEGGDGRKTDHNSTGNHRDLLVGGASDNTFNAGAGNDILHGQGGADTLNGEAGDDLIFGGAGADIINGGAGKDVLYGGDKTAGDSGAADTLTGGTGDDIYHVGKGDIIMADKDGAGDKIFLDGVELTGPGAGGKGADGATYALNGDELTVTLNGSSVTIKDFDEGKFGFKMPEAEKTTANRSAGTSEVEDATLQDAANTSSDTKEMPIKDALKVLSDEADEALRLSPSSDVNEAVSPMLKGPAAVSVMKTLVDNEQASIPVSQKAMDGNAFDRVKAVLEGSVDRLSEIDKTHEAEALYNDLQHENTHSNYAHEAMHQVQADHEDEMSYGL